MTSIYQLHLEQSPHFVNLRRSWLHQGLEVEAS
jgi:hypothetical protein